MNTPATRPCIFCEVIAGRRRASVVYRDAQCIAILDAFPLTRGHLLLIPHQHQQHIEQLPQESVAHLFAQAARFSAALRQHGACPATAIVLNNGKAANQHVPHVHLHVIPRRAGDTPLLLWRYLTRFINPFSYIGRSERLAKQALLWQDLLQDSTQAPTEASRHQGF